MRIISIKHQSISLLKSLRQTTCIIILLALCILSVPIFAAADTKVFDYANLLTVEQVESLENAATAIAETYQMDIGIVTTDDASGKSSQAFADDFYDNNGYGYTNGYDGLLFLIDMDNREIYISTCGSAISYFTDLRINDMLDTLINYMPTEDYYGACTKFLSLTESYIQKGIPSNQYTVEGDFTDPRPSYSESKPHEPFTSTTGKPLNPRSIMLSIIAALLGSALIAFIVRAIVKRTYTHPRYTMPQTRPDDFSVHYTERQDHFVTSHTSRVKIETNNSSSGRSSTHRSSSGRSHGGGGRGF